ncbi:MAG: hypothetical protein ACXABO_12575 [Promethearchaeota archaeon]|jgi:hypothetical protein
MLPLFLKFFFYIIWKPITHNPDVFKDTDTQEFEKIIDLCLKEQVFLNLIELSGAQDQDVDAIFSTLDTYLDENFGSLIEQLFDPLTFEAFISEVVNQFSNNIDNEGFVAFNVPTQEYFDKLIQKYSHTKYIDYLMELPTINVEFLQERSNKEKIIDFYLLIERINQLVNDMNLEVRDLSVTPKLARLQGPIGELYDAAYFKEFLSNNFETISKYSWFTVNRDNEIVQANDLKFKEFGKTYLKFIQDNPELLDKYYWLYALEFSVEKDFTNEDFVLLQLLDDAMVDMFGYVNYILLQMGMLNFGKDNLGRFFEFGSHANAELYLKILRETGISRLDGIKIDEKDLSSVIRSLITFGFKRTVEFTDGTTKSYIIHPPNSIFAEIFNGFDQYNTNQDYFEMINKLINSIISEKKVFDYLKERTSDTLFEKDFLKILGLEVDENTMKIVVDNYERVINQEKPDLIDFFNPSDSIKISIETKENLGRLKWVVTDTKEKIIDAINQVFDLDKEIETEQELITREDDIIDAIWKKYKDRFNLEKIIKDEEGNIIEISKTGNIAFSIIEFAYNGETKYGFIVSIGGKQFMPGTYIDSNGKVYYDPFSLINALFPPIWSGNFLAYSHSERKILISLYSVFSLLLGNNMESFKISMVSQLPFCPACRRMIVDFADIYKKLELILGYEMDDLDSPRIFNSI